MPLGKILKSGLCFLGVNRPPLIDCALAMCFLLALMPHQDREDVQNLERSSGRWWLFWWPAAISLWGWPWLRRALSF